MNLMHIIKKKIISAQYYMQGLLTEWERDFRFNEFKKKALIGKNFNLANYNKKTGQSCRIYNHNKRECVVIGDNVCIDGELFCNRNGHIEIGDFTVINHNTFINADNSIKIGKYCLIARDVLIQDNNSHPVCPTERIKQAIAHYDVPTDTYQSENAPIEISDAVWIGTKAIILKNVKIGYGSVIAAGAVVTKNIPALSVAAGNPAKIVKTITDELVINPDCVRR